RESWTETHRLMGSQFQFIAQHEDLYLAGKAVKAAVSEVRRIEHLISSWDAESQTSEINRQAGIKPVKVDWELFQLILRGKKVSKLTEGAFDLSYASLDKVWYFHEELTQLPSDSAIRHSVALIDHQKIWLDEQDTTVFLAQLGMKIGFGAIGKGYAANRARAVMMNLGAMHGLVNAGGDLICWGNDQGQPWRIGIVDPRAREESMAWLSLSDQAVVTSGDYERFAMIEGERYSHIIDPRTGWPVKGLVSVSVVCPDAEVADALATAVSVLGPERGLALLNHLRGVEGLLVKENGEIVTTDGFELNWLTQPQAEADLWKTNQLDHEKE
ncbi:MAG: FAD:protein FMN transferase, partial [Bacteroidota bacterium]